MMWFSDERTKNLDIIKLHMKECALVLVLTLFYTAPSSAASAALTTGSHCVIGQFTCRSTLVCIDSSHVCDFRSDCSDSSDEKNCVSATCGFDDGHTCGWNIMHAHEPSPDESFSWQLGQAQTFINSPYSPKHDASQETPTGWYAFATSSLGNFHAATNLYTNTIGRTGPQCKLQFLYWMDGPSVDSLIVYLDTMGTTIHLWETTGGKGKIWQLAVVFIGAKRNIVVGIQARRGQSFNGGISVDNVQFVDCKPPLAQQQCRTVQFTCNNKYCIDPELKCNYADDCGDRSDENIKLCDIIYKGRCSFTNEICSFWTNAIDDQFDWTLAKGSTPTLGTGPSVDHTTRTESGGYIYIDGSAQRKKGDYARLTSQTIKGTSQNCVLRLWFHMLGTEVGFLTVSKRVSYTDVTGLSVLSFIGGDHGDNWKLAAYDLSSTTNQRDFQVVIQGSVGGGVHNNIAIDDISMTPGCQIGGTVLGQPTPPSTTVGSCGPGQLKCQNQNKCYSSKEQCDFIDACGDNSDEATCGTSCNFETNTMCGWANSALDNTRFIIMAAGDLIRQNTDHTFNTANGHYIYIQNELNSESMESVALLESSLYYASGQSCQMTFWYNSFGYPSTSIRIVLKTIQTQGIQLFQVFTDKSFVWQKATLNIGAVQAFSLMFKVVFQSNTLGYVVAIDDISFTTCATNKTSICTGSQFLCTNEQQCIPRNRRCDKTANCNDGSDEVDCIPNQGDCTFDTFDWQTHCGWSQRSDDDADWMQSSYRYNPKSGATSDHKGTQNGQFLTISSSSMGHGDVADLQSPFFPASTDVCYIRFYYYMYGSESIGPLRVYTYNVNYQKNLMWSVSGNKGQSWQYANILVGDNLNFSVIIEATAGDKAMSDIAIDDVTFTAECATGVLTINRNRLQCDASTEFYCSPREKCFPKVWECDGVMDCPDGTDEPLTCPTTKTPFPTTERTPVICNVQNQFYCNPKKACLPRTKICDGFRDCPDGTDEPSTCSMLLSQSFKVPTCNVQSEIYCNPREECLPRSWVCDGVTDCPDGTDEPSTCSMLASQSFEVRTTEWTPVSCNVQTQFYCNPKNACLPKNMICDGVWDCPDGTDEPSTCSMLTSQFPTTEWTTVFCNVQTEIYCNPKKECLPRTWICDGVWDCPDGSDEPSTCSMHASQSFEVPTTEWTPASCNIQTEIYCNPKKACLPRTRICDGFRDCPDGSDEPSTCSMLSSLSFEVPTTEWTPVICNVQTQLYCYPSNECLPRTWICDGARDCPDGTDEPSTCPNTRPWFLSTGETKHSSIIVSAKQRTAPDSPSTMTTLKPKICFYGQFQCTSNSQCIPAILRCDGVPDCIDQSDEGACKNCQMDYYFCAKQALCKTKATRCDGADDCGDGTDESLCTPACGTPLFSCQNGGTCKAGSNPPVCVCPLGYEGERCQYKSAKTQGSTQQTIPFLFTGETKPSSIRVSAKRRTVPASQSTMATLKHNICSHGQFQCTSNSQCIPAILRCDGVPDCIDQSDEGGTCVLSTRETEPPATSVSTTLTTTSSSSSTIAPLRPYNCSYGQFQCTRNSQCIPAILRCDGVTDCIDKTDEGGTCQQCRADFIYCTKQRRCITNATRCDGADDCGDGTDESLCIPACGTLIFSCQNGGTCIAGSSPPVCACSTGYQGVRCQYKAAMYQGSTHQKTHQKSSGGWKVGVGVTLGVVGLTVLAIATLLILKKYKSERQPDGGLINPVYDGYGTEGQTDKRY